MNAADESGGQQPPLPTQTHRQGPLDTFTAASRINKPDSRILNACFLIDCSADASARGQRLHLRRLHLYYAAIGFQLHVHRHTMHSAAAVCHLRRTSLRCAAERCDLRLPSLLVK